MRTARLRRSHLLAVLGVLLLLSAACAFQYVPDAPTPAASQPATPLATTTRLPSRTLPALPTPTATTAASPAIAVFFTDPADRAGQSALEFALLSDLQTAQRSIDVAMYNFSLSRVANALIAARQRGVTVRFVTDSDALDSSQLQRLEDAGIPIVGDRREALMHDKFVVIDAATVWLGSLNLTVSGLERDDNNFVRVASPRLAENYTVEFEEMFTRDTFGADSPADTPWPDFSTADGTRLENYFSPDDHVSPRLVEMIAQAESSVEMLAYSFTSDSIAQALQQRDDAGVAVRVVFDDDMAANNTGGEFDVLRRAGLDVRLDGNDGLMHHKVIILDRQTVVLGSYNFTASADRRNDENILVIHDAAIARLFSTEFERIYGLAAP